MLLIVVLRVPTLCGMQCEPMLIVSASCVGVARQAEVDDAGQRVGLGRDCGLDALHMKSIATPVKACSITAVKL